MKRLFSVIMVCLLCVSMFSIFAPKAKGDSAYFTDIVQLTTNPYDDRGAGWSPDSSKIAYGAFADSWYRHIWVMNCDGSGKTQLTFGNVVDHDPCYSPDGTKIVFSRYGLRDIDGSDLMIMNADGTNILQLTSTGLHRGQPRWSHNGQRLAFYYGGAGTTTNEIHIMNTDGTNEITVVSSTYPVMNPYWSPDDTKLVYTMDDGIWIVNTSPPYQTTRVFQTSLPTMYAVFSPDGKYIMYASGVYGAGQHQDLYLIDIYGNFMGQLTYDTKFGYQFDWSPDGQYIAFDSISSGNYDIWRARIVTDSGLVGYWKFDEGSGNIAHDSSGNGNDGTVVGASWTSGVSSGALKFDGIDNYVGVPSLPSVCVTGNQISVQLWIKPAVTLDASTPITNILDKGDEYGFQMDQYSSGRIWFFVWLQGAPWQGIQTATSRWEADSWYLLTGTYDGSSLKMYVNGVLENSRLLSSDLSTSGYPLAIGSYCLGSKNFFNGVIDEVKIYNYARTAEEIQADAGSFVRAWKDVGSIGLENDRLLIHGLSSTGNYRWFFDYLIFKDTGTMWYQPWGELAMLVYPNFQWNGVSTSDFEVNAYTETDKAYLRYSITSGNLREELTYTIFAGKPYVYLTLFMTNIGSVTENTYAGAQFTTWIAGDHANDYFYIPGHGQGQFNGIGNVNFPDATETCVAMWDQNKGEGCGMLSTNGFVPSNMISEDFGIGEGFKFISDSFTLAPGQSSATYNCYYYFFVGTGSQQTQDFYDLSAPAQKRILIVNTPGTFGETWYLPDGTPFTLMSYLRNNGFAVDLLTDLASRPLSSSMVPSYDVVILPSWFFDTPANLQFQSILLNYVQQGGGLLFAGQSGFAETLDASLGFKYIDGGFVDANIVDYNHPIMQGITELPKAGGVFVDWDNVINDSPLSPNTAILARTSDSNNRIALIAFQYGNGRVVAGPSDGLLRPYGPTGVDSWNVVSQPVIKNVLLINALNWVAKVLPLPPTYDVTVQAHCDTEGSDVSISVWLDNSNMEYTPYTYSGLSGTHTLTASQYDTSSHPFKQWSTGSTSLTITVNSGGAYTAYYGTTPPPTYDVIVQAHCNTEASDVAVSVWLDQSGSNMHDTPHTYSGLSGTHTLTASQSDTSSHPFEQWSTGSTSLTITISSGGTYIAYYGTAAPSTYSATVQAHCNTESSDVVVSVWLDSSASNMEYTPYTYSGLSGTHTLTASQYDTSSHPFKQWSTGSTSLTITINSGGTYTVYYAAVPDFQVTVTPASQRIGRTESTTYEVSISSLNEFSGIVSLDATSTPNGDLTFSFNPPSLTLAPNAIATSTLSVSTQYSTKAQDYSITITATCQQKTKTATSLLSVLQTDGIETTVALDSINCLQTEFSIQQNFWLFGPQAPALGGSQIYWVQNIVWVDRLGLIMRGCFEIFNYTSWPTVTLVNWWDHLGTGVEKTTVMMRSTIDGSQLVLANDFSSMTWQIPTPIAADCFISTTQQLPYTSSTTFGFKPEIVLVGSLSIDDILTGQADFVPVTKGHIDTYLRQSNSGSWVGGINSVINSAAEAATQEKSTGLRWHENGDFEYAYGFSQPGLKFVPNYWGNKVTPPAVPSATGSSATVMMVFVQCPVNLSIYDSLGRHLGYNGSTGQIDSEIPGGLYYSSNGMEGALIVSPSNNYDIILVGTGVGNYNLTLEYIGSTQTVTKSYTGTTSAQQTNYYSELISSGGQATPISWEYVFKDTKHGTMLKISSDDKYFQFTAPGKDFGIKHDPKMIVLKNLIAIGYSDSGMCLAAVAMNKLDLCAALAYDRQTRKEYLLAGRQS